MAKYMVTVKPGLTHKDIAGPAVMEVTQQELDSFGDKFILPAISATPDAWALALEKGMTSDALRSIEGSGKAGRILKLDVENFGKAVPVSTEDEESHGDTEPECSD